MKVSCISQGIRPKCEVDCLPPSGAHVEQLLACNFREVLDGLLSDAILKVGIYPTEGQLLPCIMVCLLEGVVVEASVVAVVVQNFDSMFCHVLFEGKLGGKCFVGLVVELEVDKSEAGEVADNDGGAFAALLGKFAFQLCIKSHFH